MQDLRALYEGELGVTDTAAIDSPPWAEGLEANLPVAALASGSVAALASAVERYSHATGRPPGRWTLDSARITASFSGDKMFRIDGRPMQGFAELSGFFAASDRHVRTHANYPHHRAALIAALDLPSGADRADVVGRIAHLDAADIEDRAARGGAIAVAVRTEQQWSVHEAGRAVAELPLVSRRRRSDTGPPPRAADGLPLTGIRVLDLTRVIAGPVATRALALLGAEVLRVDSPLLPEIGWQHLENGQGKHSTLLDLNERASTARELLASADVLVTGYRPGALTRFGLDETVRSGLVRGTVDAWGSAGPWSGRRGFDSIVQAATGISLIEGSDSRPGALPAQALDHATGYLLAAAIVDALAERVTGGRGSDVAVSLARTATWLLQAGPRTPNHPTATLPSATTTVEHDGIRTARPVFAEFDDYRGAAHPWGTDRPAWNDARGDYSLDAAE